MASVIGFDFGNENCLVAVPRSGGVDIELNQSSNRLTPSMIAFDDKRRYHGEFARVQQMSNISRTITQLKRLVGLKYNTQERELIESFVPFDLVETEKGYVGIKIAIGDNIEVLTVEQCVAYLLRGLNDIASLRQAHDPQCVIVVSPWWGEEQRRVILDAASIVGLKVMKLVNSTTAAAITYAMYHKHQLPNPDKPPVPVAIIDFGDSSLNVAIVNMSQGKIEVKGFSCDEHMGGSHFTQALETYLLSIVQQKYKIDPTTNQRAMIRFRQATDKLKKGLSINPVMSFECPSLMNDIDVNFLVKRVEFESQIDELLDIIAEPVEQALKHANVEKKDLFAIEVHGGASRVASVKKKIAQIFGREPTQSLNADECFAQGSGFQAALMSPQYRVPLVVKDVHQHKIMIEWTDPEGNLQTRELFKEFQEIPSTKKVPVKVKDVCQVRIYDDNSDIAHVSIDTGLEETVLTKLRVRLDESGIIDVKEATYSPPLESEEKSQQEVKASVSYQHVFGLSPEEIEQYKKIEEKWHQEDLKEEQIDIAKNELESYIFQMENSINRDFPEYFDPSAIPDHKSKLNEIHAWFEENEFERLELKDYKTRLFALKSFGDPAIKRKEFRERFPSIIGTMTNRANIINELIQSQDPKYNHISQEERQPVIDSLIEFDQWLTQQREMVEEEPLYQDIKFSAAEADTKITQIELKAERIMSRVDPNAKPKEEPTTKSSSSNKEESSKEETEDTTQESHLTSQEPTDSAEEIQSPEPK